MLVSMIDGCSADGETGVAFAVELIVKAAPMVATAAIESRSLRMDFSLGVDCCGRKRSGLYSPAIRESRLYNKHLRKTFLNSRWSFGSSVVHLRGKARAN